MLYIKNINGVTMFNFVPQVKPSPRYKDPILIPKIKYTKSYACDPKTFYNENEDDINYIVNRYISLTKYFESNEYNISFKYSMLYDDLQKWVVASR